MAYLYLKALHIIFVVTWFAGLFYIVRLFIYQTEALDKPSNERSVLVPHLALMSNRLWYMITWPSAIITLLFGVSLIWSNPILLELPFMHVKIGFLILLYAYQFICQKQYSVLQKGEKWMSSYQLRIWNEVATLLLFAIVFLVVLKSGLNMLFGLIGLVVLAVLLFLGIRLYKKLRK